LSSISSVWWTFARTLAFVSVGSNAFVVRALRVAA
jgi:hypothetical protein